MDELDIVDELEVNIVQGRSSFLTVLCILTWVGSGLSIIYHAYMYVLTAQAANIIGRFGANDSMSWFLLSYLIGIFAPFFTIIGALLMWKLKRIGFFVYAVGQLVPLAYSIYFALGVTKAMGAGFFFVAIVPNIIQIGFLIMYGTRLFEMKK